MSEYINNREYRQKVLRELIMELHDGKTVDEVKVRFEKLIEGVSPTEISAMENALIREGMPVSEVQRLCDVHAAVFKGSIEEIHQSNDPREIPGHPVHTFLLENRAIERHIRKKLQPELDRYDKEGKEDAKQEIYDGLRKLLEIDKHYSRKENLLFPYLEKYEITAPPKVMWGVDDEIRDAIKECITIFQDEVTNPTEAVQKVEAAINRVEEMIFKEENILFPMALETLAEDEWLRIAKESKEIGFCMYEPTKEWKPVRVNLEEKAKAQGEKPAGDGYIQFETGNMTKEELEAMLNTLPVDITFVDKEGIVKYFSQGQERIFARTKAVIGRQVQNCHPPASMHIVEEIVEDLKSGKKDHEDFWIQMGDRFVHIRYFAVRSKEGEFLGVLEFTQNVTEIRNLTGEKRLVN
ncbi:MAG: DUF438 domain-containing protein [Clostridiales bacterium]|jgi:PAS domain S-box-containing protein|nr:DUF438 domain-containing protein [Clostridiales bacterium]